VTVFLLDVNVLLAMCDPLHVHAEAAHRWFEHLPKNAHWATCPLTENAFVRIASHPSYPRSPGPPQVMRALLDRMCRHEKHGFWPDNISLRDGDCFDFTVPVAPGQITDVYLLGLAARNGGKLATFDTRIPVQAVKGGERVLAMIGES
jgi:toxin-antitoxin system PIN domain toxin